MTKSSKGTKLNLRGYIVGNGCTNWDVDTTPAYIEIGFLYCLSGTYFYPTFKGRECEY